MSNPGQVLWCDACSVVYDVPTLEQGRIYRCARCRGALVDPPDATVTTWLYASPRSAGSRPTADDGRTTWSDTQEAPRDHLAKTFERYELGAELGRGGMGVVYRAWDPKNQREVALKVLIGGRWADRTAVERFLREARAAARLQHPGLVRVLDSGEWQGQPFYAMELIEGPSLKDVIDEIGRPPLEETLRIGAAIGRALDHAHQKGVAHRDVKPENVLLRVTGEPVLTDFGLVLEADDARLTHTGQVMGTPAYLAPELARGEKDPSWPLCDIYALGTLLYELSTGRPAYEGDSGMAVLMRVLEAPPHSPRTVVEDLPRDLEVVIQRAMARFPSARFHSAADVASELDRIATGQPIRIGPLSRSYRARLWWQRNGRTALATSGAVAVVLALVAVAMVASERMERAERLATWEEARSRLVELEPELHRLEQQGDRKAADGLFHGFVDSRSWQDTPAVADAWRLRAHHLRDRGQHDAELDALSRSWASAPTEGASEAALDSVLEALAARWWYDRVETLAGAHDSPAAHHRRAVAAVARRDLPAAGRAWVHVPEGTPPVGRLVEVLLRGTPTEHRAGQARVLEDGTILLLARAGATLARPEPDLPAAGPLDLGRTVAAAFPAGPDRLLTWGKGEAALLERGVDGWEPALRWSESRIQDVTLLDPADPDTLLVAVGAYARHLLRLDRDTDGSWTRSAAHRGTDQAASDVLALARTELDGDGQPDILVAAGPWNAFDVRWLEPGAEGLGLRARRKLGYASDLGPIRVGGRTLVAVAKSDQYPSRRTFPADHPFGEPAGLYLLDPTSGLETDDHRRLPTPAGEAPPETGRLAIGDLDGDGLEDVAMGVSTEDGTPWLFLYRQDPEGTLHHARLEGIQLLAASNLDDDPATELIVAMGDRLARDAEGQVFVLGAGTTPVPALPAVNLAGEPVPSGLDPDAARMWGRAERLASSGLHAPAAAVFSELAARVQDTENADRAALRSASLWLATQRPLRAARSASQVRGKLHRLDALDLRSRALVRAYRFEEAAAVDAELAALPARPAHIQQGLDSRAPLLAIHRHGPGLDLAFDTDLDGSWSVGAPLAVRRDPRQGALMLDAVVGTGPLLRFPLRRTDDVIHLELEGAIERVEWAAGMAMVLRPAAGGPELGIRTTGWGGGALLQRQVGCVLPDGRFVGPRRPVGPDDALELRALVQVAPSLREVQCWIEDRDGTRLVDIRAPLTEELPEGDWVLEVRSAGDPVDTPMHVSARIDTIGLRGVAPRPTPTGPDPDLQVAEGRLTEALSTHTERPSVLAAALLAELGRTEEAREALPPASQLAEGDFALLARSRPTLALSFKASLGDAWFPLWHRLWNVAIVSHPDDPALQERLRSDLEGLQDWSPSTAEGRAIRTQLLSLRGRAWWLGGRTETARVDLQAAARDTGTVLAEARALEDGNALQTARLVWMDTHTLLASVLLASGRESEAADHARTALLHAPSRELALDRLLLDPKVAERATTSPWSEVLAP